MAILPLASRPGSGHDAAMFDVHCPRHQGRVLLSTRRILAIDGAAPALSVRYRCWCGHEGTWMPGATARPATEGAA